MILDFAVEDNTDEEDVIARLSKEDCFLVTLDEDESTKLFDSMASLGLDANQFENNY